MLKVVQKNISQNKSLFALSFIAIISLFACAESPKKSKEENNKEQTKIEAKTSTLFEVEGKIFSIPSPIQTAFLIKKTEANFQSDLLNPTQNSNNYLTTFQKAINLGIYGADLGYATMYNQSQEAISYMAVCKHLSDELDIGDLFDETLVNKFEQNIGKQDSLLSLVSEAFRKADHYLKNNKRKNISALILAGGWIETLYFACSLQEKTNNNELTNRIGEQKITINNLIKLLLPYQEDKFIASLINSINELKDLYSEVQFNYIYQEPETFADKKLTIIKSKSEIEISDIQLQAIKSKIQEIRSKLII